MLRATRRGTATSHLMPGVLPAAGKSSGRMTGNLVAGLVPALTVRAYTDGWNWSEPPVVVRGLCGLIVPSMVAGKEGTTHGTTTTHPEQIIRKLAEGQKLLASGMSVEEMCRQFQIAESTWARWLGQYGGMKADDAKRLKELESEMPG